MPADSDRYAPHLRALGLDTWPHPEHRLSLRGGDAVLPTAFHIGEAAAVALALGGLGAAELHRMRGAEPAEVSVEVPHAAATLLGFMLQARADGVVDDQLSLIRQTPATPGGFALL